MAKKLDKITPIEEDFGRWYTDVVKQGNLIAYGEAKGSMIFKPISFGVWEQIQSSLNQEFRKKGIQNLYLPLLIPESLIEKEKNHVEGFAPELARVTHVGSRKLDEAFVIRPTSEVLFAKLFANEINSYNDLPLLYNQWANVLRWEKTTNPFLRNREFLWQEGHTSHSNPEEAITLTKEQIHLYADFLKNSLAMPTIIGQKTEKEKFAGADTTYTIEAMMKDGRALQSGTSHYLGQNFSKAFNIKFKNKENAWENVYQTSWGVSTRLIGGLIMTHGDNRGVIIPPNVAPNQVDIIEIFGNKNPNVKEVANNLFDELKTNFRVRIDSSDKGPGFKAAKSEIEGTPLRIEIGPRDLENGNVTLIKRNTLEKEVVKLEDVSSLIQGKLNEVQSELLLSAQKRLEENIVKASNYDEFKEKISEGKFVLVPFAGESIEEDDIKKETGASTRCIPEEEKYKINSEEPCFFTGKPTKRMVIFARAY